MEERKRSSPLQKFERREEDKLSNLVSVTKTICPAPFILRAEGGVELDSLAGFSFVGWYVWTPSKLRAFSEELTMLWES
jgi:hypothetical protein